MAGRLRRAIAAVIVLAIALWAIWLVWPKSADPGPDPGVQPESASWSSEAVPSESLQPSAEPTPTPSEPAPASSPTAPEPEPAPTTTGPPSGVFVAARLNLPGPAAQSSQTYSVQVEDSLGLDANDVANQIHSVLTDQRGWLGARSVSFNLIDNPDAAQLRIQVASPSTTDRLCRPLNTAGRWSCNNGAQVILNSERWTSMTSTYTDLGAYRAYMVNHEVGHFLGLGHASCPGAGQLAPVMLQQSKGLGGCVPNPWPNP